MEDAKENCMEPFSPFFVSSGFLRAFRLKIAVFANLFDKEVKLITNFN